MAKFDADQLTDSELRSKLAEYGHPVGPVTETTRKILIKKLKLLMKQKNTTRNSSRSLTRFSSGDESESDTDQNGGNKNSRRISMPPPMGYKSTKRKSTSQNYASDSPVPSISKVSCSTPLISYRNNLDFKASRLSTPTFSAKQSQYSSFARPSTYSSYSYDFDSASDSDDLKGLPPLPSMIKRKPGLSNYNSLSSYRSKPNNSYSRNFFKAPLDLVSLRLKNENKKEPRPFLSNFVGRFSSKGGLNDALNPFDIKESDAEDDGITEKWKNVNIRSRTFNFRDWTKPFNSIFQYVRSKDGTLTNNYRSWNHSQLLSMLLLGLFLLFFVWLALAYFKVTHRIGISDKSVNNYPLCSDQQNDEACITKQDLPYAIRLYKDVHLELQARGLRSACGPPLEDGSMQKPFMTEKELINFLSKTKRENFQILRKGINNLKLLIWANSHWGINLIRETDVVDSSLNGIVPEDKTPSEVKNLPHIFLCRNLHIPWTCYLSKLFYKIISTAFLFVMGSALIYLAFKTWHYVHNAKKEENRRVMAMVEKILNHVSDAAEKANGGVDSNGSLTSLPQDYVPIRHVHDTLIHPTERQKMTRIWEKAVKFIEENESRIRTEIQQVWGEDTAVWRWLGPTLGKSQMSPQHSSDSGSESSNQLYPDLSSFKAEAKRCSDRVWQGEAFETSEGSMNSLPSSPTQCLKIRHMFKHDKDYGPDWVLKVKDAIVEKCEGASIVHMSVDKESKEGCVYVKCASPQDAGLAYRHLHGSWFDGALVTVKYLRLERYHERFPDSAYARTPLRPSNNLRLSLQGTS